MRTSPSSSDSPDERADEPAVEPPGVARAGAGDDDGALLHRLRELRDRIERFEDLADAVRQATVWDYSVYEEVPDDRWLAIDRDHYERMVDALASVDSWHPWSQPLERRLGDV
jgi:hypothetical protein